jgi:gliding motility-associated-like protein
VLIDSSANFSYNTAVTTEFVLEVTENILNIDCSLTPTGLVTRDTLMIWVNDDVAVSTQENLACSTINNGQIQTSLSGNFGLWDYSWTNVSTGAVIQTANDVNTNTLTGLSVGSYTLNTTNTMQCNYTQTFNITASNPAASFVVSPPPYCEDGAINFNNTTVGFGLTYMWNFGDGTPNSPTPSVSHIFNTPGNYTVSLMYDLAGACFDTFTQNVTIGPVAYPDFSFSPNYICELDTFSFTDLSVSSPLSWSWDFDDGTPDASTQSPTHIFTNSGFYDVTLTANSGACGVRTATKSVEVVNIPFVSLGADTIICSGLTAYLQAYTTAPNLSYLWGSGDTTRGVMVNSIDQNINIMVDDRGCRSYDTLRVSTQCGIYMPNAFSPDGDNINDLFAAKFVHVKAFTIKIYNRWGEKIYESINLDHGWDGRYNGEMQPVGAYVYQVTGVLENEQMVSLNGNVTLIH